MTVLVGRLALAALFLVAAGGKLADLDGSRRATADFGLPESLARIAGTVIPLVELAIATALIVNAGVPLGAIGGVVLLAAFSAAIANAMAHGREPDCHCFGQIHSSPAGWWTLARNLALLVLAAYIAVIGGAHPGPSATHWITAVPAGALAGGAAGLAVLMFSGFVLWFALQLLAQNGRMAQRLDSLEQALAGLSGGGTAAPVVVPEPRPLAELGSAGLPFGAAAPAFMLPDAGGEDQSLAGLQSSQVPTLLLFSDAGCGPCDALMPDVARWQREHAGGLTIAVIASGDRVRTLAKAAEHGLRHVLLQHGREVAEAYHASGTPSAVLISPDGRIASPVLAGADAIGELVSRAQAPAAEIRVIAPAPAPPRSAPSLTLPSLDGQPMELATLYGSRTIVLFWNPGCGFCQRMLGDLRELERHADVIVVATADREATRAHGLSSPIVFDEHGVAQRAFGVGGTPMAVVVQEGRIGSPVAAGRDAVLALAAQPAAAA